MNKRKTGQEQEVKAACFLKTQGYQILERNYRCKKGEIDLIAREGQIYGNSDRSPGWQPGI